MKRMKETLLGLTVIAVFVATLMVCNYIEHHYTREQCEVLAVNGTLVEVEDRVGYTWTFYTEEENEVRVGEVLDVKMYTNLTHEDIFDDEVVNWKRSKKSA